MTMNEKDLEDLFKRKYVGKNINLCRDKMENFVETTLKLLYPAMCNQSASSVEQLAKSFEFLKTELSYIIQCIDDELHTSCDGKKIINEFFEKLPVLEERMNEDAKFILEGDPAAQSLNEVVICYPGFYAIAVYRIARFFYKRNIPIFPRILTEFAHRKTGIDIHPGAKIRAPFFIDHGTGVVIGETAEINERVKIYQGVTLGSISVSKDLANTKRHPSIGSNCIIYANATILGGDTFIGDNCTIGGNVWITKSVPENTQVFYKKSQSEINV
tara:strand:- start:21690 stop:22505 length:816 start_codon:yes stop_codon:yes gene_type:complete